MKRPFAVVGISLLASSVFLLNTSELWASIAFSALILACVTVFCLKKRHALNVLFAVTGTFVLAVLSVNYCTLCVFVPQKLSEGTVCLLEGTADDFCEAYSAENGFTVLRNCSVNGKKLNADICVAFPQSFSCEYGDKVSANAEILKSASVSPADFPDGVFLTAEAKSDIRVSPAARRGFIYYAKLARGRLAALIDRSTEQEDAAVIKALLLGDKSGLSYDFLKALRISGTSHIFAVSGMHLSLWSGVIFFFLRRRSRARLLPNIAVSLFVLFYMALTGFSPSVNRSGVMLLTVYAGAVFKMPADPINSLGLAAFILLIINPFAAADVSFLLSFSATASLLLIFPHVEQHTAHRKNRLRGIVKNAFAAIFNVVVMSLAVLLFTTPVSGEFFGTVSLLSPVSSALCTLPVEVLMLFSAAALCFTPVRAFSRLLFGFSSFLIRFVNGVIGFLAEFDFAVCEVNALPLLLWYAVTAAVCAAVYYRFGRKTAKTVTAMLICAGLMIPAGLLKNILTAKDVTIRIPGTGTSGAALVYTDLGGTAAMIFNNEDSDSLLALTQYAERHTVNDIDLLILPTCCKNDATDISIFGLPLSKDCVIASAEPGENRTELSVCLNSRIKYEAVSDTSLGVGIITCSQTRIVFCFFAGAPLDGIPEEILRGDILVCRSRIPKGIKTENFEKIIVLSDKSPIYPGLPENAVTTADTGGITIRIKAAEDRYAVSY